MMPTNPEPHVKVKRNLQATADLLDALQEDPTLLNDEEFVRRLSILREKHQETTNFLAKKVGAPPLPTVISTSKTTESKTMQSSSRIQMTTSTSCHQRYIDPLDVPRKSEGVRREEPEYHEVERTGNTYEQEEESHYMVPRNQRVHIMPPKVVRVPHRVASPPPVAFVPPSRSTIASAPPPRESRSRQAPPVPSAPPVSASRHRHQAHTAITTAIPRQSSSHHRSSSLPRHRHHPHHQHHGSQKTPNSATIRQVLADASAKYNLPTTSVAMPNGHLLTSTSTKHVPIQQPQFATTADVVEESFLEDGMSVDEVVGDSHRSVKRQLETGTNELKIRSKSMHNIPEPQVTIPKPFQLSLRKTIGNTYAKKFMSDMMSEKQRREEEAQKSLENTKFKAKPVPKSTYIPTNTFATEQKYVEAMRKKVAAVARKKFEAQNEMVRSKSEGNLASIKPLGYVPPTTYVSPIPVKPNARGRSAATRTAVLIQEATTPKGIKSHRHQSNMTHKLRHGKCTLDTTSVVQHRRTSPPDFNKIHAKINEDYRRANSKPSTVPIPFKLSSYRSQSATTRHAHCKEKEPEQYKPSPKAPKPTENRVPSTHSAQLREELNKARIQKVRAEEAAKNNYWAEDNRRRIATFLGARSKTDENIAMRTKMKMQQQQETTQEYMRQLTEMKQRVLNGPLIMEKQTALAQEHRLKRKFAERMNSGKGTTSTQLKVESRRGSEGSSAAGTFVVEKDDYEDENFESKTSSGSRKSSQSESSSESEESSSESEASSGRGGSSSVSEKSSSSSSKQSDEEENES
ncbi:hypothetical protein L3Y34_010078 [Caenorhabditis briggsae]|uniref:Uncharacterized protein n=1 Tax=Caenorhabditis briggsae TaxID=6238 RepID=A0AAE9AAH5_CAEBR|nr:hypothetical protein L3Y34_010078 [Caenorhabditis briggsae]